MPLLCNFEGMFIYMQFNDVGQHYKPHVHVSFGEYKAVVSLDGEVLAGSLPAKKLKKLTAWLTLREKEVYTAWNHAVREEHFDKVKPV